MNLFIASFFWNPSRTAFTIPIIEKEIYWYSIFFTIGIFLSYQAIGWILFFKKEENQKKEISLWVDKFAPYAIFGTVIGARIGHVLFYEPLYYYNHPVKIFMTWEGGLASHGAIVGILAAALLFWKRNPNPYFSWYEFLDALTIGSFFGALFIRIGNFFNQEIIGTPTNSLFGIIFGSPWLESSKLLPIPHHPVQLYEAFSAAFIGLLLFYIKKNYSHCFYAGQLGGLYALLLFSCRFMLEKIKLPQTEYDLSSLIPSYTVGQFLTIPVLFYALYLFIRPYMSSDTQ